MGVKLRDVVAEDGANRCESAIHAARQARHSSRSGEGHQRDDQYVLDQALASLVFVQAD